MNHFNSMVQLLPLSVCDHYKGRLDVKGCFLDSVHSEITRLIDQIFPTNISDEDMLEIWEDCYDLVATGDLGERINTLKAARTAQWELNKPFFVLLAAKMGYEIQIIEAGQPFRADISKAGDKVYDEGSIWVVQIEVANAVSAQDLEAIMTDTFPPYVSLRFNYS